jgi:Ca2+-binding EF-hand superfamily protein
MARWLGLLIFAVTVGFVLNSANGQDSPKKEIDVDTIFKKLDTNSDGKLSKDEFLKLADNFKDKEKARKKLTDAFEMIDTDKMGLSIQQFRTYFEKARKKVEKAKEK